MSTKKPKRGAPVGNQNAAKKNTADTVIAARVDAARRRRYERAASDGGVSLSGWVVRSCDAYLLMYESKTPRGYSVQTPDGIINISTGPAKPVEYPKL